MTADDPTLIEPARLKEYFLSLVSLNDDAARKTQGTVRVELYFPVELGEKIDIAIERWGRCPLTREHFFLSAALWALSSIEEADLAMEMGLDNNP